MQAAHLFHFPCHFFFFPFQFGAIYKHFLSTVKYSLASIELIKKNQEVLSEKFGFQDFKKPHIKRSWLSDGLDSAFCFVTLMWSFDREVKRDLPT